MRSAFWRKVVLGPACVLAAACSGGGPQQAGNAPGGTLTGAGATFPYPLYSRWFSDYAKLHPDVRIDYQSIGSGGGIRQLLNKTVFFGATDSPMTDAQLAQAGGAVLHVPAVLGAVVPIYNLEGVTAPLRFSGPLLADIVLGKVRKWNDPALAAANPGVPLPDAEIAFVHRADGSGTTFILCDYLAKVSPEFAEKVGASTSVAWPVGVGAKGNEGVAGLVRQAPASLGYVELIYALQNDIAHGAVQNSAGRFVHASLHSVTAAAAGAAASMPDDFRVSITGAPGEEAYPVASFTWILLREDSGDPVRSRQLVDFLRWALTEGQATARALNYAPLPPAVAERAIASLARVRT